MSYNVFCNRGGLQTQLNSYRYREFPDHWQALRPVLDGAFLYPKPHKQPVSPPIAGDLEFNPATGGPRKLNLSNLPSSRGTARVRYSRRTYKRELPTHMKYDDKGNFADMSDREIVHTTRN